jgi:ParB-like chromosome segregation protein Spo0J
MEDTRSSAAGATPAMVPIGALRIGDSPRTGGLDPRHAHRLATTADLPPILVHRPTMTIVDGAHRLRAAELRGCTEVSVRFIDGTADEAFLAAVRSNTRHGLPLSLVERTSAARRIMIARPSWSDRAVAATVGLSVRTVTGIRRTTEEIPQLNTRIGLDGRIRPVSSVEGRERAADFIRGHPQATLRQIASAAGISVGTARDVRRRLALDGDPLPPAMRASQPDGDPPPSAPRGAPPAAEGPAHHSGAGRVNALSALARDPALRSTDFGRLLLRLLDNGALTTVRTAPATRALPAHTRPAVAAAVRQCIDTWRDFVRTLDDGDEAALSDSAAT